MFSLAGEYKQIEKSPQAIFIEAMLLYSDLPFKELEFFYKQYELRNDPDDLTLILEEVDPIYLLFFKIIDSIVSSHPEASVISSENKKIKCENEQKLAFVISDKRNTLFPIFDKTYKVFSERQRQIKNRIEKRLEFESLKMAITLEHRKCGKIDCEVNTYYYIRQCLLENQIKPEVASHIIDAIKPKVTMEIENKKIEKFNERILGPRLDTYVARQQGFAPAKCFQKKRWGEYR